MLVPENTPASHAELPEAVRESCFTPPEMITPPAFSCMLTNATGFELGYPGHLSLYQASTRYASGLGDALGNSQPEMSFTFRSPGKCIIPAQEESQHISNIQFSLSTDTRDGAGAVDCPHSSDMPETKHLRKLPATGTKPPGVWWGVVELMCTVCASR